MVKVRAVVLLAGLLGAATPTAHAATLASASSASWKQIYEDSQTIYYVDMANLSQTGEADTASLLEFKIPQVVEGAQVWSVVSRMKLNCDERQVVTVDNTSYASQMGDGKVVQSQATGDTWHTPEPGSLGELIWSTACGKQ